MSELEDMIRDRAKRGELTHLSLSPHGKGWQATYSLGSSCINVHSECRDPVDALTQALKAKGAKLTRKRITVQDAEPPASDDDDFG